MDLEAVRSRLWACRQAAEEHSEYYKDPSIVQNRLWSMYEKFDDADRGVANSVICEWVLSEDSKIRFDATDLAHHFKIREAIQSLEILALSLERAWSVHDVYEREKIVRIIQILRAE